MDLEQKILSFLSSKRVGVSFTALQIAKGVGLSVSSEVNPILYRMERSGRVHSKRPLNSGNAPLWSLCSPNQQNSKYIHPYIHPSIHPSTHPSIHPPILPSIHPPIHLPLSGSLSQLERDVLSQLGAHSGQPVTATEIAKSLGQTSIKKSDVNNSLYGLRERGRVKMFQSGQGPPVWSMAQEKQTSPSTSSKMGSERHGKGGTVVTVV